MRYVGPGSDGKHLHADERDALWQAGLSICLLAEGNGGDALGGNSIGMAHGASASAGARSLGAPATTPIYFAVDFDCTVKQWPSVAAYLRGCAQVIGLPQVGVYGSTWCLEWAKRDKVASWFFQAYAPAWSGGDNGDDSSIAHVRQYKNNVTVAGGSVDLCRAPVDSFGQWTRQGVATGSPDVDFNQNAKLDGVFNLSDTVKLDRDATPDGKGDVAVFPVPLTVFLKQLAKDVAALKSPEPAPVDLEAVRKIVREELDSTSLSGSDD
jgi:hypothetical protein